MERLQHGIVAGFAGKSVKMDNPIFDYIACNAEPGEETFGVYWTGV